VFLPVGTHITINNAIKIVIVENGLSGLKTSVKPKYASIKIFMAET